MLIALIVTKLLGPIISTIIYMFNDIKIFVIIWFIVIFMFTLSGIILFQEIPELNNFSSSFPIWIQAAMGDYDISIFDVFLETNPFMYWLGVYNTLTFVFINILVLINVVIAMMTDTYSLMTSVRKGLYNYNIIKATPSY